LQLYCRRYFGIINLKRANSTDKEKFFKTKGIAKKSVCGKYCQIVMEKNFPLDRLTGFATMFKV